MPVSTSIIVTGLLLAIVYILINRPQIIRDIISIFQDFLSVTKGCFRNRKVKLVINFLIISVVFSSILAFLDNKKEQEKLSKIISPQFFSDMAKRGSNSKVWQESLLRENCFQTLSAAKKEIKIRADYRKVYDQIIYEEERLLSTYPDTKYYVSEVTPHWSLSNLKMCSEFGVSKDLIQKISTVMVEK